MRLLKIIISVISLQLISASVYALSCGLQDINGCPPVSVPEAGTLGMLVAGLVGMAIIRRRHRHKKDDY